MLICENNTTLWLELQEMRDTFDQPDRSTFECCSMLWFVVFENYHQLIVMIYGFWESPSINGASYIVYKAVTDLFFFGTQNARVMHFLN